MKLSCCLLICLFAFLRSEASDINGYIVTLAGDTIRVKVKRHTNKIMHIVDQDGHKKTFTPKEIKGFGAWNINEFRNYRSKPVRQGDLYFLEVIIDGDKARLFQYPSKKFGGSPGIMFSVGGAPPMANNSQPEEFYTFERENEEYLYLSSYVDKDIFKSSLKTFYRATEGIQQFIEPLFKKRRLFHKDMEKLLDFVNSH